MNAVYRPLIFCLVGVCIILLCVGVGYIIVDIQLKNIGLFKSGGLTVLAVFLAIVVIAAIALIAFAVKTVIHTMPKQQKARRIDSVGIIRYKIIFGEYLRGLKRIMKCKKCKADIPDELHPVYCCYCGEKLQRERKKKDEIKIPTPRKRGQKWYVDLRREGVMVIEATEAEARAKALAIRTGVVAAEKKRPPTHAAAGNR